MQHYQYPEPAAPRWFTLLLSLIGICLVLALLGYASEQDQKAADLDACYASIPAATANAADYLHNCTTAKRKERENGTPH